MSVATPAILLAACGFAPLRADEALPPGASQAAISESAIPQIAAPQIVAPHIVELGPPAPHAPPPSKVSRITRIERFGATSAGLQDPALSSLDRDETAVEPPTSDQPGAIFNSANLVETKPTAKSAGELAGHSLATIPLPLDLDAGAWLDAEIFSKQTVATCWTAAILMTLAYFRRAIFAAINRSVFWAVAMFGGQKLAVSWQAKPGRQSSGRRSNRRRSSRSRLSDVGWYFRRVNGSYTSRRRSRSGRSSSRPASGYQWSPNPRSREYVVSDAVYSTAPAPQPNTANGRYLLSCSDN